jgi:hypothetical protein
MKITDPHQRKAEARAERHARTFVESQRPPVNPQVLRLKAEGYLPVQIASILAMPLIDVRLMLAIEAKP